MGVDFGTLNEAFHGKTEEERNEIANDVFLDGFMGIWQAERDAEIEADEDARLERLAQAAQTNETVS